MHDNIISFNLPNVITITVIGLVGFTVYGWLANLWKSRNGG